MSPYTTPHGRPLYAGLIPRALLSLVMDATANIKAARADIEERNYGLADEQLQAALDLLPFDTEGGTVWPALEERTSA